VHNSKAASAQGIENPGNFKGFFANGAHLMSVQETISFAQGKENRNQETGKRKIRVRDYGTHNSQLLTHNF